VLISADILICADMIQEAVICVCTNNSKQTFVLIQPINVFLSMAQVYDGLVFYPCLQKTSPALTVTVRARRNISCCWPIPSKANFYINPCNCLLLNSDDVTVGVSGLVVSVSDP